MKFSIVTPSFNQGPFIERTLASVHAQQGVDFEHVVFDGGSSDRTVDILSAWAHKIRSTSEPDRGQTEAVNKGIRATDGEIIGWLNSDDVYYAGAFAEVAEYFGTHPDIDIVYGQADHIDVEDRAFEAYPTRAWDPQALKENCFISQPAVFFRRSVVDRIGLLDERLQYCMDYEYWLRASLAGIGFAYLEKKLAGSRLYPGNKTMSARVAVHGEINDMLYRTLGVVPDRWLYNYAHIAVSRRIDRSIRPKRYALELGLRSLAASFKWNGRVSQAMRRQIVSRGKSS